MKKKIIIIGDPDSNLEIKAIMKSREHLQALGINLPIGAIDSHGDVISEDCEITFAEGFTEEYVKEQLKVLPGVQKYGKSDHGIKMVMDSIGNLEEVKSPKASYSFDEPKSKYINKPQRNWKRR